MNKSFIISMLCLPLVACMKPCGVLESGQISKRAKLGSGMFGADAIVSNAQISDWGESFQGRAMVTNNTHNEQHVKYKFTWQTIEGYTTGESTPWVPLSLSAQESATIQSASPSHRGIKYTLRVCKQD